MTLPGPLTKQLDAVTPRTLPTDTGVWFVSVLTEKGPTDAPTLIQSPQAYAKAYGGRGSAAEYATAYDSVETFFRAGSKVYLARHVGPAAAKANHDLSDATPAVSLHVKAKSEGEWGNALTVRVLDNSDDATIPLGQIQLQIADTTGVLETSSSFVTQADAVAYQFENVDVTVGVATDLPVKAAATALSGGSSDRAGVTDAIKVTALALFTADLGPGQVSIPGATSDTVHAGLAAHAVANNRHPLYDHADTNDVATLKTSVAAIRALVVPNRYIGASYGPPAIIPGLTSNTTRTVPYSAVQAGLIARLDAKYGNPNLAAAGENGIADYVLGVTQTFNDADREELNNAGYNVARVVAGQVRTYGIRTTGDPVADAPLHIQAENQRLYMAVQAQGNVVAESEEFKQLDGKGVELAKYGGKLVGALKSFFDIGAIYGDTPDEAFRVDVGPSVNTPEQIASGQPKAVVSLRPSPAAEVVELDIVRTPITQAV